MRITYIVLGIIAVLLGIGLVILPQERKHLQDEQLPPERLMAELYDQTRFLSTDEVAKRIIEGDPSYLYIDIRSPYEFAEYSLPGAINIPLEEILMEDWRDYLAQEARTIVFYGNGSVKAEQAWLLAQRLGYENNNIMEGGLNAWIEDIIRPEIPPQTASEEAFKQYRFRLAASRFFGGGSTEIQSQLDAEPVIIERKQKKRVVEGGC